MLPTIRLVGRWEHTDRGVRCKPALWRGLPALPARRRGPARRPARLALRPARLAPDPLGSQSGFTPLAASHPVNGDSPGLGTGFSPLAAGGPASGEKVALGRLVRLGPEGVLGRLRALDRVRHRLCARAVENRLQVVPDVLDGQLGVRVAGRIAEVAVPDPPAPASKYRPDTAHSSCAR